MFDVTPTLCTLATTRSLSIQNQTLTFTCSHQQSLVPQQGSLFKGCEGIAQIILICKVLWTELCARCKWLDLRVHSVVEQTYTTAETARQCCCIVTHTVQHNLSFSQQLPGRRMLDQDTHQSQLLLTWIVSWPCP